MFATFLTLAALQAAASADTPIIVTGRKQVTAEYETCRNGGCPPVRDVNATLAYAQQQLLAGDYRGSRAALKAGIRRTSAAEKTHPLAVAALYEGDSTVALHWGDQEDARRSGLRAVAIKRGAYGAGDPRSLLERAQIGAVEERVGRYDDADRSYRSAAGAARAAGLTLLADTLDLRRAALLSRRGQATAAQSQLVRIAEGGSYHPKLRLQAAVMATRVASQRNDEATVKRMLDFVGTQSEGASPVLVYSPPIMLDAVTSAQKLADQYGDEVGGTNAASALTRPIRWADVGYWVRPDGRVDELEVLRGNRAREWLNPILRSIESRRYAAFDAAVGDPGKFRVERFTLTRDWLVPVGTMIRQRAGQLRLRTIDITRDPSVDPRDLT